MSKIYDKYKKLKENGFDLGQPLSAEQNAGYGPTDREYQKGNIYWHPVMGASAHEVHGGILSIYSANGGPGVSSKSRIREFGFPLTDENRTALEQVPYSEFETGAIYWTPSTGGVFFTWDLYSGYKANASTLGLPVANMVNIAGGQAVYCERGVVWAHPSIKGTPLIGTVRPPLLGNPQITTTSQVNLGPIIEFSIPNAAIAEKLASLTSAAFTEIWQGVLFLRASGTTSYIGVNFSVSRTGPIGAGSYTVSATASGPLLNSTLYDLVLRIGADYTYDLSPHCLYAKDSWENFGLLHATDIHLSLRNQNLGAVLAKKGMGDAARQYTNFQDSFRDFIRYVNHLHSIGLADAVVATGDLIDYIVEAGDNPHTGNFARFRNMVLGTAFDAGVAVGEELKVPIYCTFGNHDYRPNPYDLRIHISAGPGGIFDDSYMDNHSSHNLTPLEATVAQGGDKEYGLTDFSSAFKMLAIDKTGGAYAYFAKYFSTVRSFVVEMGPHCLVVLDSLYDDGIPQISGWEDLLKFCLEYERGTLPPGTNQLINGCNDVSGLLNGACSMVANAANQACTYGVVIVGVHVPPFAPKGGEYPYYLRETLHPHVDSKLTEEYLNRNSIKSDGWTTTGTSYFRTGEAGNGHGLDNGVPAEYQMDFLRVLAGLGYNATRPVDLLLCGHHHDRTEYRIGLSGSDVEYYMDFYLEEPAEYYSTIANEDLQIPGGEKITKGSRIHVKIQPGAAVAGTLTSTQIKDGPLTVTQGIISLPPYATPLDTAADAKQWWAAHRPLIVQTAALGPIDPRQRYDAFWQVDNEVPVVGGTATVESPTEPSSSFDTKVTRIPRPQPDPTFEGFRVVLVSNNVIQKVHYVTIAELRAANFVLPWELQRGSGFAP
jgi:hypothetical protein